MQTLGNCIQSPSCDNARANFQEFKRAVVKKRTSPDLPRLQKKKEDWICYNYSINYKSILVGVILDCALLPIVRELWKSYFSHFGTSSQSRVLKGVIAKASMWREFE